MRRSFSYLFFFLSLSFFLVEPSSATDFGTLSMRGPSSIEVQAGRGIFRTILQRAPGQGVDLSGEFQNLIKRKPYVMTGLRTVTGAKIAQLSLTLAKRLGPVGLAFTLYDIVYDSSDGLWKKEETEDAYLQGCWKSSNQPCFSSPMESCLNKLSASGLVFKKLTKVSDTRYNCYDCINNCTYERYQFSPSLYYSCPPLHKYDPATDTCVLKSLVPVTDAELLSAIEDEVNKSSSNAANQASKVRDDDERNLVNASSSVHTSSGPASTVPEVSTKTSTKAQGVSDVDGDGLPEQSVTETVETTTSVVNMDYQGPVVELSEQTETETETTTTVTKSTDGTTTTTTTTDTTTDTGTGGGGTNPDGPGEGTTESEWPAFCAWAEIMCHLADWFRQEFSAPDDVLLPVEDVGTPQTWSLGFGSGTCPPDVRVNLMDGKFYDYSYQVPCDVAVSYIRPVMLILCSILAVYIIAGVKE